MMKTMQELESIAGYLLFQIVKTPLQLQVTSTSNGTISKSCVMDASQQEKITFHNESEFSDVIYIPSSCV